MSRFVIYLLAVAGLLALSSLQFVLHSRRATDAHRGAHPRSHAMALIAQNARESDDRAGIEQARYEDKAYPHDFIDFGMRQAAALAFESVARRHGGKKGNWQALGPATPVPTIVSGRITALALSPSCASGEDDDCRIFVGAAGGGVWTAEDALGSHPEWRFVSSDIPTNAIGSIAFDPSDRRTIYVGTGEANQSADSEAGSGSSARRTAAAPGRWSRAASPSPSTGRSRPC